MTDGNGAAGPRVRRTLSRREALRRGAMLGGSLLWTAPAVQTIRMSPAFAEHSTPVQEGPDISYICMNILCNGEAVTGYHIKYEGCVGDDCFESDPGNCPHCPIFTINGQKTDGDDLGFQVTGPDPVTGCVTITAPPNCEVVESAIFGGLICCLGPSIAPGSSALFCPCPGDPGNSG